MRKLARLEQAGVEASMKPAVLGLVMSVCCYAIASAQSSEHYLCGAPPYGVDILLYRQSKTAVVNPGGQYVDGRKHTNWIPVIDYVNISGSHITIGDRSVGAGRKSMEFVLDTHNMSVAIWTYSLRGAWFEISEFKCQ
jgi:hypothetical protein